MEDVEAFSREQILALSVCGVGLIAIESPLAVFLRRSCIITAERRAPAKYET